MPATGPTSGETAPVAAGVLDELRTLAGDPAPCAADAASLPAGPGAYLLLMTIARPLSVRIRTLTPVVLPSGWYVYAGSARGRGGIRAGVKRHLRRGKSPYWQVDRLTEAAEAIVAIASAGMNACSCRRCPPAPGSTHPWPALAAPIAASVPPTC